MQKVQAEPAPGTTTPRWVGTGRTIFNNKGNPVKQYEPFFSATSDFETEDAIVATGVTPIIHYDPLDRVIRTELPDGSESRVEFDAWQQKTFDPNDAVAGTPWLTQHQAGTADQQRAAALALAHADTPTIALLDSLGRTFLVRTDNGPDPATPAGPTRLYDTRTKFDIEGNVLSITDARGVQVITQRFDVLQRRLRVDSPDAGARLAVADVAGKPLRAWDNRAQTMRSRYDALQRPTHMFVALGAAERLLLRTVFGESLDPPGVPTPTSPAQALNLRGKPYLAFDCAGLVTAIRFDFKGNLLAGSRRLATDYTTEPNWTATESLTDPAAIITAASPLLETEHFDNSTTFDALNRVTTHTTPDNSVTRPEYNEANLLNALFASVRGAPEQAVIANLDYNARGQRISCQYGNGTTTTYTYDPKSFRLTELQTLRGATKLQWLLYTFDPVGNIVALRDQSDTGPIFGGAAPVSGDGLYEYDPLYRLLKATGREHPATQPVETDPPLGTGVPHANDLQALLAYSETYVYDPVGNIQQMAHVAGPSGSLGWTRNYEYATNSNRLLKTSVPGSPLNLSEPYTYDQHGSMTSMPRLPVMDWDYADRLRHTQKGSGSGAQDTYFTYDAAGQRARKVAVASGTVKERIYLGGYEVYRERTAAPGATIDFERQTLHVMDDQRRVAMAETKTVDGGAVVPTLTTRWRFQLDNHLGSATLELDGSGNVISYEEYHPYGSTAFHTADGAAQVSAKRYRYTGKEKDEETGLYYHGARYYAPWLGRWTAADPLDLAGRNDGGSNSYGYVRDNPLGLVDRDGLQDTAPQQEQPQQAPVAPKPVAPKPAAPKPAVPTSPTPARSVGLLQRLREFVNPPKLGPTPEEPIKEPERTYKLEFKQEATAEREINSKLTAKQRAFVVRYFQVALEEAAKRGLAPEAALLLTAHAAIETGYGQAGPNVKGNNFLSLQPPRALQEELEKRDIAVPLERRQNRNAEGELVSQLTPSPQFKDIRQSIEIQLDLAYGLKLPAGGELKALFPSLGRELKDERVTPQSYGQAAARAGYAGAGTPEAERYTRSLVQAHQTVLDVLLTTSLARFPEGQRGTVGPLLERLK